MRQEIDLLRFPHVERELGKRTKKHRAAAARFDKDFFDGDRETGYGGYIYDGRWQPVALRLLLHYGLMPGRSRVLDIGCAKGFLVQDLRMLGIHAYGMDISKYAAAEAAWEGVQRFLLVADARELTTWPATAKFDLIVSINTLHNLERGDLARVLASIDAMATHKYITVDAWRDDAERARMEAWNLTARTMMSVEDWKRFFRDVGYTGDYGWFTP